MTGALRPRSLDELASRRFDLLVIGAGIIGARIAYEAARAGLSVALVDAGDFGGGTSSASSKLLHGDFRYLARCRFGLVREAQRERAHLAGRVAPHLIWPCPLVVALESPKLHRRLKLAAGIGIYDTLAGFRSPRPRRLSRAEAMGLVPSLDVTAAGGLGLIHEMQTHDGRLTLATVGAAVAAGATAVSYAKVVSLEGSAAVVEDAFGAGPVRVRFRAIVNATGPWVDRVRQLETTKARPIARLSKGTQAMLVAPEGWLAGLAIFDERRSVFATPWQGMLLLGATDTPFEGDPASAAPGVEDVRGLCNALARLLPPELLHPKRILSSYSGVRVLPLGTGATVDAPREHVIDVGPSGMVSVGGGKLTTHRLIALEALRRLPFELRPRRLGRLDEPLPGAGPPENLTGVEPTTAAHLFSLYGSNAADVLACTEDDPGLLEPIHPAGPDIWAQVRFALEREWALTTDDVLRRRTTVALRGLDVERVREEVDRLLSSPAPHAPAFV